jgi:hypothetical protein
VRLVGRVGDGDPVIGLITTGGRVAVGRMDVITGVAVGRTEAATGAIKGSTVVGAAVNLAFTHPVRRRKTNQEGIVILM